jgi:hypothetical protein
VENAAADVERRSGELLRIVGYGRLSIGTRREVAISLHAFEDGVVRGDLEE